MKILIAGAGKLGTTATKQLIKEGFDITLMDHNSIVLERIIENYDVMTYCGNAVSKNSLINAGIKSSDLLIAVTDSDEKNLLICLTAKWLNPDIHTIARVRDPEISGQITEMRDVFALSMLVNPEQKAAHEMERLLKFPGFLKRDSFAKDRVEIVELGIDGNSKLCNLPLTRLNSVLSRPVIICAVLRGEEAIVPRGDFIIEKGDKIFVTASTSNLSGILADLGIVSKKTRHVMLLGGGRISYYLAERLLKNNIDVDIIERDMKRCEELAELLPDANIIHGDCSNQELLEDEGISDCNAVVTLTGIDEQNMILSLYAKTHGVPQIVTKIGRIEDANIINTLDIGSVVSPKDLCCNSIVRYVRAMRQQKGAANAIHFIADKQMEALEFRVEDDTQHVGIKLKDLRLKKNIIIACITKSSGITFPNGDSFFESGDTVIVIAKSNMIIHSLNDIFD